MINSKQILTNITGLLKGSSNNITVATAADVTGQLITGYASVSGTLVRTDTILQAINKLNGNILALNNYSRIITTISSATNAGNTAFKDYIYFVSGTTTLTLPTAVGNTNMYTVKNTGVNTISITGSQAIDGSVTVTLTVAKSSLNIISDGVVWRIV